MIAECHIGFEKLLSNIVSFCANKDEQMIDQAMDSHCKVESDQNDTQKLRRSSTFHRKQLKTIQQFIQVRDITEQKLWYHGKAVGTISGQLKFVNLPFLQQMKIGVLTNQGITFTTKPVLHAADTMLDTKLMGRQSDNFKKLIIVKDKLIKHDIFTKRLEFLEILNVTKEIVKLLHTTEK